MNPFDAPSSSLLRSAFDASSAFGSKTFDDGSIMCEEAVKMALEAVVVDEFNRCPSGYTVALVREGSAYRLTTSGHGPVRFEGLDDASYTLCLVGQDQDAWELIDTRPLDSGVEKSDFSSAWGDALSPDDFRGGHTKVKAGEGVDKIGLRVGHLPGNIASANQDLLKARQSRNALAPGDKLTIPPRRPRRIGATPGNLYVLRRLGTKARLRLRVLSAFDPIGGEPYLLELSDGTKLDGITDNGYIDREVPAAIEEARLQVKGLPRDIVLPLDTLLPIQLESNDGVRQRLINLGVPCDAKDPTPAIRRFQQIVGREPTGKVDDELRGAVYHYHDRG